MKTIIFTGHYTVGEVLHESQVASIEYAKQLDGNLGMLVNDIDLVRKVQFYQMGGKEMLIRHYGNRIKCGTLRPMCELPNYREIPKRIDWSFYNEVLQVAQESDKPLKRVLREDIVPKRSIEERLKQLQLNPSDFFICTERQLRNKASYRLSSNPRKNGSLGWRNMMEKAHVLQEIIAPGSSIPTCGAIMLALFEEVSRAGYNKLIQVYAKSDKEAVENGKRLCHLLHKQFPEDMRWQLEIENIYV